MVGIHKLQDFSFIHSEKTSKPKHKNPASKVTVMFLASYCKIINWIYRWWKTSKFQHQPRYFTMRGIFFNQNTQDKSNLQTLHLEELSRKSPHREDTHAYKSTDLASKVRERTSVSDHQLTIGCKNTNLLHVSNTAQQNSGTDTFTGHRQTNQNKGTGNLCLPP